jgi:hypothetical protein
MSGVNFAQGRAIIDRIAKEQDCGRTMDELLSYGPPWAHYLGRYQDGLLGGPLGLLDLCYTTPDGVERKYYDGGVLG